MAQGTLQRCFSRMVSCFGHAIDVYKRQHQESAADLAALKKLLAHFGGEPFGGEADSLEAMLGKLEAR